MEVRLGSLGVAQGDGEARPALLAAHRLRGHVERGFEWERRAVRGLERTGNLCCCALGARQDPIHAEGVATCRVEREPRPVDADIHRLDLQRDALQDPRQWVADDGGLCGVRVDANRGPDDDGPEVKRPRDRGNGNAQSEGGALIWAREKHLAPRNPQRARPGTRSSADVPDETPRSTRALVGLWLGELLHALKDP